MTEIQLVKAASRTLVGVRRSVNVKELPAFFAEVLPTVGEWLAAHSIQPSSMPMAMWCAMDMETGVADCHAGFFVEDLADADGEISVGRTAEGDVLTVTNVGPYSTVGASWQRVYAHAAQLGRVPGAGWEIYVDDPSVVPESELRTEIFLPVT